MRLPQTIYIHESGTDLHGESSIAQSISPYKIRDSRVVTQEEAYYVDRQNRLRLPALFVHLTDSLSRAFTSTCTTVAWFRATPAGIVGGAGSIKDCTTSTFRGFTDIPLWDVIIVTCAAAETWHR